MSTLDTESINSNEDEEGANKNLLADLQKHKEDNSKI
jgi:hypothetical protein